MLFKVEVNPEDINCDGCQSNGGRLFNYCKVSEIRNCEKEKRVSILSSATPQMQRTDWIKSIPSFFNFFMTSEDVTPNIPCG